MGGWYAADDEDIEADKDAGIVDGTTTVDGGGGGEGKSEFVVVIVVETEVIDGNDDGNVVTVFPILFNGKIDGGGLGMVVEEVDCRGRFTVARDKEGGGTEGGGGGGGTVSLTVEAVLLGADSVTIAFVEDMVVSEDGTDATVSGRTGGANEELEEEDKEGIEMSVEIGREEEDEDDKEVAVDFSVKTVVNVDDTVSGAALLPVSLSLFGSCCC